MWSLCETPISTSNLKVLSQSFSTSTLQSSRNTPFENQSRLWLHDLKWACGILSCALKMGDQKHKMKSSHCVWLCLSSLSSDGCLNVSLQKLSTAKPNTLFPSYKGLWMCWCPVHLATQHRQIKKGEHDISVFGFVRTLLMQHWLQSTTPLFCPSQKVIQWRGQSSIRHGWSEHPAAPAGKVKFPYGTRGKLKFGKNEVSQWENSWSSWENGVGSAPLQPCPQGA